MKKVSLFLVMLILVVGVVGLVHADDGPGPGINATFVVQGGSAQGANSSLGVGIQAQNREGDMNYSPDYNQSQERERERLQNQTHFENETQYQFKNSDGKEYNFTIRSKFMAGANGSEHEIEFRGYNVSSRLNVSVENQGNGSSLRVNLSNGKWATVKVLPDVASERAIQVFQNRNITVVLKQVGNGTNANVVYEADTNKTVNILGLFRARANLQAQINADNGTIIRINKPWWYFLTFGSGALNTTISSNETNITSNTSVNDSSNTSGNASV